MISRPQGGRSRSWKAKFFQSQETRAERVCLTRGFFQSQTPEQG